MTKQAAAFLLSAAAVWVCAGGARAVAQAGVEAGAIGAASSAAGSAAGKATGSALGSVLGRIGSATTASTNSAGTAAQGTGTKGPGTGSAAGSAGTATSDTMPPFIRSTAGDADEAVVVEGPAQQIHFDVVSFRRCNGGVSSTKVDLPLDGDLIAYHCQPVFWIIQFAYAGATGRNPTLGGYPDWVETELYNFEARVASEDVDAWQKMDLNARRVAVRGLLADALKLKVHVDTTPRPVYTLTVAAAGPKIKAYAVGEQERLPNGLMLTGKDMTWVGHMAYFQDMSMGNLAERLTAHLDRQVLDQTGLAGEYNFQLPLPYGSGTSANADLGENIPSVAEGLAELGLRLEPGKAEVGGLVVDHIARPAED